MKITDGLLYPPTTPLDVRESREPGPQKLLSCLQGPLAWLIAILSSHGWRSHMEPTHWSLLAFAAEEEGIGMCAYTHALHTHTYTSFTSV